MSVEENVRVVDAVDEAGNARNWDRWVSLHAADVTVSSPEVAEPIRGREAHLLQTQGIIAAFPDARLERHRLFGQDEWLCAEYTVTGTHRGPLLLPGGRVVEATSRPVRLAYCTVYRIRRGLILREGNYYDLLGLLDQLGALPGAP